MDDASADGTAGRRAGRGGPGARAGRGRGDRQPGDRPQPRRSARAAATRSSFSTRTALPRRAGSAGCSTSHERGAEVVGGSLDLPPDLSLTARCDYYCGWYHVHSRRQGGEVSNHPPGNLSVRRERVRAHGRVHRAAAHRLLPRGAGLAGGRAAAGGRIVFDPAGQGLSTTTARDSATCSAATIAGVTAPSRARPARAPHGWHGSTGIRACSWPGACRSPSEPLSTSSAAGRAHGWWSLCSCCPRCSPPGSRTPRAWSREASAGFATARPPPAVRPRWE